jgi:hypothetical protein
LWKTDNAGSRRKLQINNNQVTCRDYKRILIHAARERWYKNAL